RPASLEDRVGGENRGAQECVSGVSLCPRSSADSEETKGLLLVCSASRPAVQRGAGAGSAQTKQLDIAEWSHKRAEKIAAPAAASSGHDSASRLLCGRTLGRTDTRPRVLGSGSTSGRQLAAGCCSGDAATGLGPSGSQCWHCA